MTFDFVDFRCYTYPRLKHLFSIGGSEMNRPKKARATTLLGIQFGDEGKGKITDLLAEQFDIVMRFGGGANAGHTLVVEGRTYKVRQIPSGVVRGRLGIIGNGCVVDPMALVAEMGELRSAGCEIALLISDRAHLVLPWHQAI